MNDRIRKLPAWFWVGITFFAACSSPQAPTPTATLQPTAVPVQSSPTAALTAVPTEVVGGVDVALQIITVPEADVVARVNNVEIDRGTFLDKLRRELHTVTNDYALNWYDEETRAYLPDFQDDVILLMIREELARQLAAEEGIAIDATARQAELDRVKASVVEGAQFGSWEAFLATYGSTQEDIEQDIHDYLIYQRLLESHGGPRDAEQVHAFHILVDSEEKGNEVLQKLASGSPFGELATEYSLDSGSAANGGDLGWFPRGVMVPEFEEVAFSLEIGVVSDLVQSQFGYHIIRIVEKRVRDLDAQYLQAAQQKELEKWFADQLDAADVETLVQFGESVP